MNFIATIVLTGALLISAAAPSAEPVLTKQGAFSWFTLSETRQQAAAILGPPAATTAFADDLESWQYKRGGTDGHDYSHALVFRKSTGKLVSITRNWEPEQLVDAFFPPAETKVQLAPNTPTPFGARVRRLSGGRLLVAMGSMKAGQPTGQLLLIAESEVRHFIPWLTTTSQ